MENLRPFTLGPLSGGVIRTTDKATHPSTKTITPMAIAIPFQFRSLDEEATNSYKNKSKSNSRRVHRKESCFVYSQ